MYRAISTSRERVPRIRQSRGRADCVEWDAWWDEGCPRAIGAHRASSSLRQARTECRRGLASGSARRRPRGSPRPRAARDGRARGSGGCAPRRVAGPAGAAKRCLKKAIRVRVPITKAGIRTRAHDSSSFTARSPPTVLLGRCPSRWQNSTWRRSALALLSAHLCNLNSSKKKEPWYPNVRRAAAMRDMGAATARAGKLIITGKGERG